MKHETHEVYNKQALELVEILAPLTSFFEQFHKNFAVKLEIQYRVEKMGRFHTPIAIIDHRIRISPIDYLVANNLWRVETLDTNCKGIDKDMSMVVEGPCTIGDKYEGTSTSLSPSETVNTVLKLLGMLKPQPIDTPGD